MDLEELSKRMDEHWKKNGDRIQAVAYKCAKENGWIAPVDYIHQIEILSSKEPDARKWLEENNITEYHFNPCLHPHMAEGWTGLAFSFKNESDAMLFKLTWA